MNDDLIERVAKAIYERPYAGKIGKYWHRKWEDASVARQTMCRRDAQAAIDAYRAAPPPPLPEAGEDTP